MYEYTLTIFKILTNDNRIAIFWLSMASFASKSVPKCAKVRSHIAHPKKGRTHAHRTQVSRHLSHAHRTRASVRAHVRVRIFFRNSQIDYNSNWKKLLGFRNLQEKLENSRYKFLNVKITEVKRNSVIIWKRLKNVLIIYTNKMTS